MHTLVFLKLWSIDMWDYLWSFWLGAWCYVGISMTLVLEYQYWVYKIRKDLHQRHQILRKLNLIFFKKIIFRKIKSIFDTFKWSVKSKFRLFCHLLIPLFQKISKFPLNLYIPNIDTPQLKSCYFDLERLLRSKKETQILHMLIHYCTPKSITYMYLWSRNSYRKYSKVRNKRRGMFINFWKNLKDKKCKMNAMPWLM